MQASNVHTLLMEQEERLQVSRYKQEQDILIFKVKLCREKEREEIPTD